MNDINRHCNKPPINLQTFSEWPSVSEGSISNNGFFASYIIENCPIGARTGIVLSLLNDWRIVIANISGRIAFSSNNRKAVWINGGDSLGMVRLGSDQISYIASVGSYELKGDYVICRPKIANRDLLVINIRTNESKLYSSVSSYQVSEDNESVALLRKVSSGDAVVNELNVLYLHNGKLYTVWRGGEVSCFVIDRIGEKVAWITIDSLTQESTIQIVGISKVNCGKNVVKKILSVKEYSFKFQGIQKFGIKEDLLFITLTENTKRNAMSNISHNSATVNIWSFNDARLPSSQLFERIPRSYVAVVNIRNCTIIKLEGENELMLMPKHSIEHMLDTLALLKAQEINGRGGESKWNDSYKPHWYTISTINGHRTSLDFIGGNTLVELSPNGRYVVYYDNKKKNYFSYDVSTKKIRNLTYGLDEIWGSNSNSENYRYTSIAGWGKNDATVFIYGQYDIWQIDPSGKLFPLNLTNGFGRRNAVVFSLVLDEYNQHSFNRREMLLLMAFNQITKANGFYQKRIGTQGNPDSLTMDGRIYDTMNNQSIQSVDNFAPVKAERANNYILKRMSTKEAPNYFSTKDFRIFKPLSELSPEKGYNWYTSELHTWKTCNGDLLQGILYKPENFDSSKMYPIIFHYYDKKSDGLNAYIVPDALSAYCNINIPYFTSNGYLVFCPDIHYAIGDPLQGVLESIVSAVKYLSQFSFVNISKMGLQGGSWGGVETNYLITQTSLFKAACSSSGMANSVSGYGAVLPDGTSLQGMYELGQFRMGATLWERPLCYIKNSPVLFANGISTPILLMHTKNDDICPFSNVLEFFIALRRLGKRSWMLVYEGNHGLYGGEARDFSLRMKQFFDHYLLDSLPPIWMTVGVPARLRGIESGLNLDVNVRTPVSNLIKEDK